MLRGKQSHDARSAYDSTMFDNKILYKRIGTTTASQPAFMPGEPMTHDRTSLYRICEQDDDMVVVQLNDGRVPSRSAMISHDQFRKEFVATNERIK